MLAMKTFRSPPSQPCAGLPFSICNINRFHNNSTTKSFATLSFDKNFISNEPNLVHTGGDATLINNGGTTDKNINKPFYADHGTSTAYNGDGNIKVNGRGNGNGTLHNGSAALIESQVNHGNLAMATPLDQVQQQATNLPTILPALPPSQLNLPGLISQDLNNGVTLPAAVCNAADTMVTSLLSPAQLKPSVNPQLQLTGNCTPVSETPPTICSIKGALPSDLNGAYIRNGPNATRLHSGEGYHLFDGDGMLHSVKFKDGQATFCARYVKTSRFRQEEAAGRPLFPKFFGGLNGIPGIARMAVVGLRAGLGLLNLFEGWGLSNTSVGYFNGKVLSLSEDDMPYVIKVMDNGDLVTVGHFQLAATSNMCAHPKFDSNTGEMFAFSFNPPSMPPFTFFRVSADGIKSPAIPVPLMDIPLVHDFALTRRYVIFPDNQLVIRPLEFLKGESALTSDGTKTPRFCLLPRYALPEEAWREARWFEAPGCNCLHYVNAWEEGSEVVLITPVLSPPENILEVPAVNTSCTLSEIRMNTETGKTAYRKLCMGNFEFGTMNQKYVGRKSRYAYLASGYFPHLRGVVKADLQAGDGVNAIVGERMFGDGTVGAEPFFVPRKSERGKQLAEDDGYLMCYVHNENERTSQLLVMDALSPLLDVIATVQLPSRVPVGFHGWFISEEELAKQAT